MSKHILLASGHVTTGQTSPSTLILLSLIQGSYLCILRYPYRKKDQSYGKPSFEKKEKSIKKFHKDVGWRVDRFMKLFHKKIVSFQMMAFLYSLFGIIKIETPAGSLSEGCYASF